MFERLLDLIFQGWHLLAPLTVVEAHENAGVLRLGKYHRTLEPGFHWKYPFFETVNKQNVCVTTVRLPPQTLTTKDGKGITVGAIVKYEIKDVRPYITDIFDATDVLLDVTMGSIAKHVRETECDAMLANPPEDDVIKTVRAQVNRYGFRVLNVTFTDLAQVRAFRMIQDHQKDLAN
jgi:membrane protease subunit HflK